MPRFCVLPEVSVDMTLRSGPRVATYMIRLSSWAPRLKQLVDATYSAPGLAALAFPASCTALPTRTSPRVTASAILGVGWCWMLGFVGNDSTLRRESVHDKAPWLRGCVCHELTEVKT